MQFFRLSLKPAYALSVSVPLFLLAAILPLVSKTAVKRQEPPADEPLLVQLGQTLFNDSTLSNPQGMACVTCHNPSAGFSYPDSDVNKTMGPVPGIVAGRFGNRIPPTVSYSSYLLKGPPVYDPDLQAYVGGFFWDGRSTTTTEQAKAPFVNPNEMNNLLHNVASPAMVVNAVKTGPSGALFMKVFGPTVFSQSTDAVYALVAKAIAAFEASDIVSPFSSKYDMYVAGKTTLTLQELNGLRLVTGRENGRPGGIPTKKSAHCMDCHGIPQTLTPTSDIWTNSCFANLGVPKNLSNPFYGNTDKVANPVGYNALGKSYIDYGLGDFMYPKMGKPIADLAEGDPLMIDGTFKAPTLRNVDRRPNLSTTKAYMHNGYFKTLQQVVHFYNTRNTTTVAGEVIDFTKPDPYAGLKGKPIWPVPEWPSALTLINPQGLQVLTETGNTAAEQIGNMGLSANEEAEIVAFLRTLTDGYWKKPTTIP